MKKKKAEGKKMYLVILTDGGGDTYYKVVDQETFDWICSDDPGRPEDGKGCDEYSWPDQLVPPSQAVKMKADHDDYQKKYGNPINDPDEEEDGEWPLRLSSGSWENDRAIAARPADGYDDYDSVIDATRAIKKHGDELEDEYHGCMY